VIAVMLDGKASGDVTKTHRLWEADLPKECVGSPVITGGHAYLVTQFGSLACLDLSTGRKVREQRLSGTGDIGGRVVARPRRRQTVGPKPVGEVFVVKASPELEVLATNVAREETTCASPAVVDGQVFLRTYDALWCFGEP
jgi:outer membrane protein assembly factor BamB